MNLVPLFLVAGVIALGSAACAEESTNTSGSSGASAAGSGNTAGTGNASGAGGTSSSGAGGETSGAGGSDAGAGGEAGAGGSDAAGSGGSDAAGAGGSDAGAGGSDAAGSGGSDAAGSGGSDAAGAGGSAPANLCSGQDKWACDPLSTAATCQGPGSACDLDLGTGQFQCYPAPNDVPVGGSCDNENGPYCAQGSTCVSKACARYCCTDTDCGGNGTCTQLGGSGLNSIIGVCVK